MRIPLNFFGPEEAGPAWGSRYRLPWAQVIGRRVRGLRLQRDMTIVQLAGVLRRADGRPYSPSFLSRLERGWASPPLFAYIALAHILEVGAGELLGTDGVERQVSDAELTMVRVVRSLGLTPEAAITRLIDRSTATEPLVVPTR